MVSIFAFSLICGFVLSLVIFLSGGRIRHPFRIRLARKWMRMKHQAIGFPTGPLSAGMFLTWFGISGLVTCQTLGVPEAVAAPVAILVGGVMATAASYAVTRFFSDTSHELRGRALMGKQARVSLAIPAGGIGRIACEVEGHRISLPARASDSTASLNSGARVLILELHKRVALVEEF